MFGLRNIKLVKKLKDIKPQLGWLEFSNKQQSKTVDEIIADNKFVEEDLKIRAMVEDMLEKEFSSEIKKSKQYDFLVDSVVNKLKQKQLGNIPSLEDVE